MNQSLLLFLKKLIKPILLILVVVILFIGFSTKEVAQAEPETKTNWSENATVKDKKTKEMNVKETIDFSTTTPIYVMVHAIENTTFSSETIGTLAFIAVKEGDTFNRNDVLLEFDCRIPNADLKKVAAQEHIAQSALESAKKLEYYGSISITELIKAQSEEEMAKADVEKLTAVVDKCKIKAPYTGSVSQLMVHAGETVKPGDPLLKILSSKNLNAELQVPSKWLKWLHVGVPFKVKINELDKVVPAVVERINPEIDPISQTVKIIGRFHNPPANLLPGMSGEAIFTETDIQLSINYENDKLEINKNISIIMNYFESPWEILDSSWIISSRGVNVE